MDGRSPAAGIALSQDAWERLAKDWLVEVIERTPLVRVGELPLGWISGEAPALIAEVLGHLSDPGPSRELELTPAGRRRVRELGAALGPRAAERLPRELAALQALVVRELGREIPRRDRGEFERSVSRLAEVFGAVLAAAMEGVEPERGQAVAAGALDGPAELRAQLRLLIADHRRTSQPFALAHAEVDGIDRIRHGYGDDAAERIAAALADVVRGQLAGRERVFDLDGERLALLVPECEARDLVDLGGRITEAVEAAQVESGPRVDISLGLASYPLHGLSEDDLLDAAERAAWAARAAGEPLAIASQAPAST